MVFRSILGRYQFFSGGVKGSLVVVMLTLVMGAGCQKAEVNRTLLPVPLPSLEGLNEAVQQQLQLQHSRTESTAGGRSAPERGQDFGTLGQMLFTYDFLEAAEPAFRNAAMLQPEETSWPYYLGMVYRQQGRFGEAASQFEAVLQRQPQDRLVRVRLADALAQSGHPEEARQHLEAVLSEDAQNALAHFLLGQLVYEAGDYETARTHFEAVLALQPQATQVHTPLGLVYRNLGDEARSTYHLARRGQAVVTMNDPRVAQLEAFKQATDATSVGEGEALLNAGRYQEAEAVLRRAIVQDATNASNYLNLGVALSYQGNQNAAIEAFQQAIQRNPNQSKAHFNLAAIFLANRQKARAEEHFRAALAADARHGPSQLQLAELLRRDGRCQEAIEHFLQALEILPGDIAARQHLALCYLQVGQHAVARAVLEEGLIAFPDHLGFVDGLARVLAASPDDAVRDKARALVLAQQAVTLRRRIETLETLAMAYAENGRFDEAIVQLNEAMAQADPVKHRGYLQHLRESLARYQKGQPSRAPWPPFIYLQ